MVKTLSILMIMLGVIFSRPMSLGYFKASVGVALFVFAIWTFLTTRQRLMVPKAVAKVYVVNMLVVAYACLVLARHSFPVAMNQFVISAAACTAMALYASDLQRSRLLVILLRIVILSGIATQLVFWSTSLDNPIARYEIFSIPIKDRVDRESEVFYLPISTYIIAGQYLTYGVAFARQTFLAIEPGVAIAVVALWRALEPTNSSYYSRGADAVFLVALAATGSTTAPLVAVLYYTWRVFFLQRLTRPQSLLTYVIVMAGCLAALLFAPGFGIVPKLLTHSASFEARAEWYAGTDAASASAYLLNAPAALAHFFATRKRAGERFAFLFPVMVLVSFLNVIFAMPLYFLMTWVSVRISDPLEHDRRHR